MKELCSLMQLTSLGTVCDLFGVLLLRFARWVTSSVQAPTGHVPHLRRDLPISSTQNPMMRVFQVDWWEQAL